jgi:beta-N-acetylhexosaminidase
MKYSYILILLFLGFSCKTKLLATESSAIEQKLDVLSNQILSKMTDEEKAGQVIHIAIPKNFLDEVAISELKKIRPGGVILFGVNLGKEKEIRTLNRMLQLEMKSLKALPLLISSDQEGGRVIRVESGVTSFPGAMAMGQTENLINAEKIGFITSYELRKLGINLLLAPVLDINNNPENPVINTRSFGMDLKSSEFALAYERGARTGGAIPVIKHFPGHGDTTVDSHLGLPIIKKTETQLDEFELIPFKKSIDEGALAIMSAHIVYPNLDPDYPATLSKKILTEILRKKLGFKGLVFTDAMEMDAIAKNYQNLKTGSLAIQAGADVILLTSWGKTTTYYHEMILDSIKKKEFIVDNVNYLDESIKRQIKLKLRTGLFQANYSFLKIQDKELEDYISKNRKLAKEKYNEFKTESITALNKKISNEAIKSFQSEFKPFSLEQSKNFIFILKNEIIQAEMTKLDILYLSEKSLPKILKKNPKATYVFDTREQKDLDFIKQIAQKETGANFILLHFGSPFADLPILPNCKIIFSFSPTKESLIALVNKTLNSKNLESIPPAKLFYRQNK